MNHTRARPIFPNRILQLLAAVTGLWGSDVGAQGLDVSSLENKIAIGFLTDVPARWMVADENPMEAWARACNEAWARGAASGTDSMYEAESRESLDEALLRGRAEVVPMYAYDWLIRKAEAAKSQRSAMAGRGREAVLELEPLAVVLEESASGHQGLTEFVIVSDARKPVLQFQDLKDKKVLEHGGQWGDLVGYWLDWQVQLIEGTQDRKLWGTNTSFKRAASAQQAMLAVYFGEVNACVVTRAEYEMVLTHNPEGLRRRLSVFPEKRAEDGSNQFPGILLVARSGPGGLHQERKDAIRRRVNGITRVFPSGKARLEPCDAAKLQHALKPLEDLMQRVIRARLASLEPQPAPAERVQPKLSSQIGSGMTGPVRAQPERRQE